MILCRNSHGKVSLLMLRRTGLYSSRERAVENIRTGAHTNEDEVWMIYNLRRKKHSFQGNVGNELFCPFCSGSEKWLKSWTTIIKFHFKILKKISDEFSGVVHFYVIVCIVFSCKIILIFLQQCRRWLMTRTCVNKLLFESKKKVYK